MNKIRDFLNIIKEIIREPNASRTLPYLACIFVCIAVMEVMWLASIFFN